MSQVLPNDEEIRPVNYLNQLLQKNSRTNSKAQQYVMLKNVQISEKLMNGQELIANQKTEIKALKPQKQAAEKKIILIQTQSSKTQGTEKIYPKSITDEERLKFVKQKIKENKIIAKRKQQQMKLLEQKEKRQKQKEEQQQLKKLEQMKLKRLQQTRKKLELIQKRKQQRILQNIKTNQILKEKSKEKILAQKIHQQFLSSQNLILQQKKKKLAQIRQIHKPMDRQEIQDHMKKFQQSRIQRSRHKSIQKSNISKQKLNSYYRSMFHDILEKQRKQKEQEDIQQYQRIKQLKQKSKKYAQEIKNVFKPQIDEKKREEIQKRIKSSSLIQSKDFDNKIKGMEYLQFAKQYAQKNKKEKDQPVQQKLLMRQQANKTQHTDYLAQIRKNNADSRLKRSVTSAEDFIKKVEKKNISTREKQQKIIQFAEGLQRRAREKEQQASLGSMSNADLEVDKLYISAIQAKLKALQA